MMNRIHRFFGVFSFVALISCVPLFVSAQTTAPSCTNLTADVSSGMTDTVANGPILTLQNFLLAERLLFATPNGHFGPATLAAVENFQSAHGISATGYVGPLTRAFIENQTCSGNSAVTNISSSPSTSVNTSSVSTTPTPAPQTFAVTSPVTNQSLTLGSNYTIQWNGNAGYNYSIILEGSNGIGEGIIASSLSTGNQYIWHVGKIISSDGTGYQTIVPGTYQIVVVPNSGQDLYSGSFTVVAPPLSISSITPSVLPADGNTSAVLFGSGFISGATSLYINGSYGANVLFVSPDGKIIVFSLPTNVPAGVASVDVTNQYGSTSNYVTLTVTNPLTQ